MAASDTSAAMKTAYFRRLAEMTPAQRVNIALDLWRAGDALQRAAIRREHPEIDEEELLFRLAVSRFGRALACKAYRKS